MGSYNGFLQSVVTGVKIPCLIFLSLLVCFPALYVIQYMIGSTMSVYQMSNIILSGFIVFSTIALSFAPIVVFFMITSRNYAFLKLLHVSIFTFSGIFAVKTIINGLTLFMREEEYLSKAWYADIQNLDYHPCICKLTTGMESAAFCRG